MPADNRRVAAQATSGEQLELGCGDHHAVVTTVGAGLRAYEAGGHRVIDGYKTGDLNVGARGQVLAPWPNRVDGGRYRFDGIDLQLPITEVPRSNAIHGLVRWAEWRVAEHTDSAAVLTTTVYPQDGYPFCLDLRVTYRLAHDGLTVTALAKNAGEGPLPYGIGFHPWFDLGVEPIDTLTVMLPANQRILTNERMIPSGTVDVADTDYDFRSARPLGPLVLDTCFTAMQRDIHGRVDAVLTAAESGRSLTVWMDGAFTCAMLVTSDILPGGRRTSVAVEPMTCPANAFRSGDGLIRLEPGETHTAVWGIVPG